MKLTICLVTRGRSDFLDKCLESLKACLDTNLAQVLVFDNGAPAKASLRIASWCNENKVELIKFEENDSRPTRIWNEITHRNLDWVVFPGDDDIFIPEALLEFQKITESGKALSAVAFNMSTIDSFGTDKRIVRRPQYTDELAQHIAVARSFHEPQFHWPSLFFRATVIPQPVPASRFYFDWWIGQQLIMAGPIATVNQSSIWYRVHSLQESNLADSRRKYFEASYWSLLTLDSKVLSEWLKALGGNEVREFWQALIHRGPIYANDYFGSRVLIKIAQLIGSLHEDLSISDFVLGSLASHSGVYLKNGDVSNFELKSQVTLRKSISNVYFRLADGSCDTLRRGASQFSLSSGEISVFTISCKHSQSTQIDFEVACDEFSELENDQIADKFLILASSLVEERGELEFIVTNSEKYVVLALRKFKGILPGFVLDFAKKFFGKSVHPR